MVTRERFGIIVLVSSKGLREGGEKSRYLETFMRYMDIVFTDENDRKN